MGQSYIETANGVIDGTNRIFTVSRAYVLNSTSVFVNGKMYRKDWDDGWTESNPLVGEVTLNEAPMTGDVVQIFYADTSPAVFGEELTPIRGVISDVDTLHGVLLDPC